VLGQYNRYYQDFKNITTIPGNEISLLNNILLTAYQNSNTDIDPSLWILNYIRLLSTAAENNVSSSTKLLVTPTTS